VLKKAGQTGLAPFSQEQTVDSTVRHAVEKGCQSCLSPFFSILLEIGGSGHAQGQWRNGIRWISILLVRCSTC